MEDAALLAYLESFLTENRKQLFREVVQDRTQHFTVAVEDVFQLHNASAVMRSCDVFGIQDLHVIEQKYTLKMEREIAMGAQKWVDVSRYNSSFDCMQSLREKGYRIIATSPHNDSCMLQDFDVTQKAAFFFGTEKGGLSQEVLDHADGFLKIPMVGFTESLNISVSAAIILQHVTNKLRNSDIPWQLTEQQMFDIRLRWTKRSIKSLEQVLKRYYEEQASDH